MCKDAQTHVNIEFSMPSDTEIDAEKAYALQELHDLLGSNSELVISGSEEHTPGKAKAALVTTLAVVGAVTGVAGLVLQAVSIWQESHSKYSISFVENDITYTVEKLSRVEYLNLVQQLNQSRRDALIQISIKGEQ